MKKQFVCTVCGYNMVDRYPQKCPFCGAGRENYLTAAEVSRHHRVIETPVTDRVSMLKSHPALGFEHAAYRLDTGNGSVLIDCPATFDQTLAGIDRIMYTHNHFLGAGNLYRDHFKAELNIHLRDAGHDLCRGYVFDNLFVDNFTDNGIEAVHINGHTQGFTIYRHRDCLFVCDYVFYNGARAKFNPYGPVQTTRQGGTRLYQLLRTWDIRKVCGFDYVADFSAWWDKFEEMLSSDVILARHEQ